MVGRRCQKWLNYCLDRPPPPIQSINQPITYLQAYGGSGHCNDPDAPTYIGSIQIEVDYDGGWMRTAETRLTDLKHDGGLSAFNWEFVDTFHNMYNFDPNEDCGTVQVTISNDLCG